MALEINTEWNAYNKPNNDVAIEEETIYSGPKNKALGKHIYKDDKKRWNKTGKNNTPNSIDIYKKHIKAELKAKNN